MALANSAFEFRVEKGRRAKRASLGHVAILDGYVVSEERVIELELCRAGYPLVKATLDERNGRQVFQACVPLGVTGALVEDLEQEILGSATLSSGKRCTYAVRTSFEQETSESQIHPLLTEEVFPALVGSRFVQQEIERLLGEIHEGRSFDEQMKQASSSASGEALLEHIRSVVGRGDFGRITDRSDLSNVQRSLPSYYDKAEGLSAGRCSSRVCIVTSDLVGPTYNGGMGTFCTSLAETLSQAGAVVTILFVPGRRCEKGSFDEWAEVYREKGITLLPLPFESFPIKGNGLRKRSYEVYSWLRQHDFDTIHFHDMVGYGYYSTLAKRCGVAFEGVKLCVEVHSPHRWHWHHDSKFFEAESELEMDFMERRSIESADLVLGPSAYLLNWVQEQGWSLPEESYVLPYPLADHLYTASPPAQGGRVDEIVFFGRLEKRKGLPFFCDVLDELHKQGKLNVPVSFLGKIRDIDGLPSNEYIELRAANWPVPVLVESEFSHHEGLAYLKGKSRLAVLASRSDNSPYTVYECLALGVPFIASDVGGIPELIAEEDKERTLFPLDVAQATSRLAFSLERPIRPVKPRYDPRRVRAAWVDLHSEDLASDTCSIQIPDYVNKAQSTSIEVVIDGRGVAIEYLESLFDSLVQGVSLHVVLLREDGEADDCKFLADKVGGARNLSVLRSSAASFAEVWNQALVNSRSNLLLFIDGKDLLCSDALKKLLSVQQKTRSSLVSSLAEHFVDDPDVKTSMEIPLGPLVSVQCLRNVFGSSMFLAERSFLLKLGGFYPGASRDSSIRELYSRALILDSDACCLIPEPLIKVRYQKDKRNRDEFSDRTLGMKPALEASPRWVREMLYMVQGLAIRVGENQNLEEHANSQIDWTPEIFHSSKSLLSMPKDNLAMSCSFEDCSATNVREGMLIHVDGPVGFVNLPMTLVPRCKFVAVSLSMNVNEDCDVFVEFLRDHQQSFNIHNRLHIPMHHGDNQEYRMFLADNLSGFFRLRFKKEASPILLEGIEMRCVD
jgi:glycosyltransferase involved in cell wall biosynthesis